ncbi:MAG: hypothetical protein ACREAM_13610, partial [Blastocatellia bacterium]
MSANILWRLAVLIPFLCIAQEQPASRLKTRLSRFGDQMTAGSSLKRIRPDRRHAIVEFEVTTGAAQVKELESRGARVLQYVSDKGLLISARDSFFSNAPANATLMNTGEKVSPLLALGTSEESRTRFVVEFHADVDAADARTVIHREGLRLRDHPELIKRHLLVEGTPEQMR